MPTSDMAHNTVGEESPAASGGDYRGLLARFAADHVRARGWAGAVEAYHAVRAMPYFSGADRTPEAALRSGQGACTARHIILRDLLRGLGVPAEVEMVECDFAAAVPKHPTMPARLAALCGTGGIRDIHCWVRARNGADSVLMDATWPDALVPWGFTANRGWRGTGDTVPAATGPVRSAPEDVLAGKEELLAELTEDETRARRAFLADLSSWLKDLPEGHEGGRE